MSKQILSYSIWQCSLEEAQRLDIILGGLAMYTGGILTKKLVVFVSVQRLLSSTLLCCSHQLLSDQVDPL